MHDHQYQLEYFSPIKQTPVSLKLINTLSNIFQILSYNNFNNISRKLMFDSKHSPHSKYDLPTAAKTNYQDFTPYRPTTDFAGSSYRSPSRYSLKLNEAKNTLSGLIGEVDSKRNINREGIKRVHDVNTEALQVLGSEETYERPLSEPFGIYDPATPQKNYNQDGKRRKPKKTSGFQQYQSTGAFPSYNRSMNELIDDPQSRNYGSNGNGGAYGQRSAGNQYRNGYHAPTSPFVNEYNNMSSDNENKQLRQLLRQQMLQNQELQRRIQSLQSQKNMGSPTLRKGVPESVLRELDELKRQNDKLRKDTVVLLQQKH